MTINFLDEFDLLNEKDDINDKESFSESLDSDDLVETSTPKLDKVQTTGNNKISKAAISVNIKTEDSIANSSEDFEDTALVTKTVNTPVTVSKAIGTASSKADENTLVSSTVINSKNIESNTFDNKITESKNEEETEAKPTKRFTKPDPFAETAPILTKRQKKKLEQKMLLKESIRVREETQFVSGLGRRRHREASEEEKDTSASSSTVSTPSISKPEIGLSITTESQKTAPKVSHSEISKPKKTSKKFKKLDFSDLENLDDPSAEKFEPAWANEKSDVHSVADEVDKISREGKAKLASKEEPVSKVSPTLSPVSEFSKQENKPSVKETSEVADVKPSAKAKTSNKLISKIPSTETGKKPTELISLPVSVEENKPSLKSSTKTIASNSLNQKNNTEKISTREVKPILKELKSDASVTVVTPLSKKSNPAKQKKEDLVEESVLPTESVSISEGSLNLEEDDELIDTIVDPDFIEDLVSRTLQSTSSNFASFFNTNPQFITQSSPTFSSSEFESYTPDTDITTEEISMDLLCKLLSPNVEIKVDVSLEQAEECLKQSKKMLESLETSFVDSVKETAMAYKNIKKKDKH